jgi:membrane protein
MGALTWNLPLIQLHSWKTRGLPVLGAWWSRGRPTVHYLMQTEAHVYALAISASVLLAFYPFLKVMMWISHSLLHWRAAEQAIYLALDDFFAREAGGFFSRNLPPWGVGDVGFLSAFLLLFTANGIFEPLEVALNRAWGVPKNRSYLKNQLVALGLIFACGFLALLSLMFTALNQRWLADWTGGDVAAWLKLFLFKIAAVPLSILSLFLVYWLLPNRKVPPARVAPAALCVGLLLEGLKYLNLLLWPLLGAKLKREYEPFRYSATIVLWSFVASLIVLGGAEWTARRAGAGSTAQDTGAE